MSHFPSPTLHSALSTGIAYPRYLELCLRCSPNSLFELLSCHSLVPSPSFWVRVERKGEKEGLGDNPGWKCPESRNSATGVDYESWPQLQGAKPLRRKSRKPDQVDIARYSKEQIDAAIDAAVQAFGLESLKHQQQKAIEEFVSGRDVFVALPAVLFRSSAYSFRPSACRQRAFDYGVCVHLPSW